MNRNRKIKWKKGVAVSVSMAVLMGATTPYVLPVVQAQEVKNISSSFDTEEVTDDNEEEENIISNVEEIDEEEKNEGTEELNNSETNNVLLNEENNSSIDSSKDGNVANKTDDDSVPAMTESTNPNATTSTIPSTLADSNALLAPTPRAAWYDTTYGVWHVYSWQDMVDAFWATLGGTGTFAYFLEADISMTEIWNIDGMTFTIYGNNHSLINNTPEGKEMIYVTSTGRLIMHDLTFNGNYHQTSGADMVGGSSSLSSYGYIEATNCQFNNNWNFGYTDTWKNTLSGLGLGGGTGCEILGGSAVLTNCTGYDNDGATFFIKNDASMTLNNCYAWSTSWGACNNSSGTLTINNCGFVASRGAGLDGGAGIIQDSAGYTYATNTYSSGIYFAAKNTLGTLNLTNCNGTIYDYNTYIANNPDVQSAFGGDWHLTGKHYAQNGMQEGRVAATSSSGLACIYTASILSLTNVYGGVYRNGLNGAWCNEQSSLRIYSGSFYNCNNGVLNSAQTSNAVQISNGNFYNNNNHGFDNQGSATVSGGSFYNNGSNGINNTGSITINGGSYYSNKQYGVANNNAMTITSGNYRNNQISGIFNASGQTLTMSNGNVYSNSASGMNNDGTANISGGNFYSNPTGIDNSGTLNLSGSADIYNNSTYGVYNSNVITMSGNALIDDTNSLYLAGSTYLRLNSSLTNAYYNGGQTVINLDTSSRIVGRKMVVCTYNQSQSAAQGQLDNFRLAFDHNVQNSGESYAHYSALRVFVGTNGKDSDTVNGTIVLSGLYQIDYRGYAVLDLGSDQLEISAPNSTLFYWMERTTAETGETATMQLRSTGQPITSLVFKGWSEYSDGRAPLYTTDQLVTLGNDKDYYAVFDTDYSITYLPNGATDGDAFTDTHVSEGYVFAENPFSREEDGTKKNPFTGEDEPYTYKYSHQGWSEREDATYRDNDIYECGETLDTMDFLLDAMEDGNATIDSSGNVTIYLNAVWDQYPVIDAQDLYYSDKALTDGTLTESSLLNEVIYNDKEDGQDIDVSIIDFNLDDFRDLGDNGAATVTYQAIDKVGNISTCTSWIHITKSGKIDQVLYPRHLDEENYRKSSTADGGMEDRSKWTNDPEYVQLIEECFNRNEEMEKLLPTKSSDKDWTWIYDLNKMKSNSDYLYVFESEDITKSQQYVTNHGLANREESNALKGWLNLMSNCRK